jgi:molybdopterin biosynthesis enzyme
VNSDGVLDALSLALAHADAIIIAIDSGPKQRNVTAYAIDATRGGRIVSEGVRMTPGTSTVLGVANNIPILGIPGAAVPALLTLRVLGEPIIRRLCGRTEVPRSVSRRLRNSVVADGDMETLLLVHVGAGECTPVATSALRSAPFAEANGFVRISPGAEIRAHDEVVVESLDGRLFGVL